MKQIITIVKPFLAERVIREVEKFPLEELVVREAKGFGRQKNYLDQYSNNEFSLVYVPKVEICAWVQPEHVAAVVEAIVALHAAGKAVTFYPFILMDQLAGNGLPDPWNGAEDQPVLPWRGRITTSVAPGGAGSPDQTAAAEAEVAAFFGAVLAYRFRM